MIDYIKIPRKDIIFLQKFLLVAQTSDPNLAEMAQDLFERIAITVESVGYPCQGCGSLFDDEDCLHDGYCLDCHETEDIDND